MEPKPKERIVFDEDSYYGDEGEEMAINDLMERDGLTEDEVREDFTDDEIFNHQMEMKDFDYEEEMRALAAFFNGEKSDMSDFVNPYGGNHILVSGSVGRWNGTSTGIASTRTSMPPPIALHPVSVRATFSPTARFRRSGTRTARFTLPVPTMTDAYP